MTHEVEEVQEEDTFEVVDRKENKRHFGKIEYRREPSPKRPDEVKEDIKLKVKRLLAC